MGSLLNISLLYIFPISFSVSPLILLGIFKLFLKNGNNVYILDLLNVVHYARSFILLHMVVNLIRVLNL